MEKSAFHDEMEGKAPEAEPSRAGYRPMAKAGGRERPQRQGLGSEGGLSSDQFSSVKEMEIQGCVCVCACVCTFHESPRPQSWPVNLEECGTRNPDRARKRLLNASPPPAPLPGPGFSGSLGGQVKFGAG